MRKSVLWKRGSHRAGVVVAAVAAMALSACGGGEAPADNAIVGPAVACATPGTCEVSDALLAAARQEGEVVMYSTLGSALMNKFNDAMQKKYGIKLVFSEVAQAQSLQRIQQEFDSGNYQADLIPLGEPPTFQQWMQDGLLATLQKAEIPNLAALPADNFKDNGYFMWGGPAYTLGWNKNKLPGGVPPNSYCDLADPKWKGNFALTFQPGATTGVHYHMMQEACGNDILTKFKDNGVRLFPATAQANTALAAGEFGVLLTALGYQLDPLIAKGAPLGYRLQPEGITISTRWSAIPKHAPHVNAAKVFVNFLLSKEGQEIAFGNNNGVSILPPSLVPDALVPPGKVVYADVPTANKYWPDIAQQLGQHI